MKCRLKSHSALYFTYQHLKTLLHVCMIWRRRLKFPMVPFLVWRRRWGLNLYFFSFCNGHQQIPSGLVVGFSMDVGCLFLKISFQRAVHWIECIYFVNKLWFLSYSFWPFAPPFHYRFLLLFTHTDALLSGHRETAVGAVRSISSHSQQTNTKLSTEKIGQWTGGYWWILVEEVGVYKILDEQSLKWRLLQCRPSSSCHLATTHLSYCCSSNIFYLLYYTQIINTSLLVGICLEWRIVKQAVSYLMPFSPNPSNFFQLYNMCNNSHVEFPLKAIITGKVWY